MKSLSLWDMIEFFAGHLFLHMKALQRQEAYASEKPPNEQMTREDKMNFNNLLQAIFVIILKADFEVSNSRINETRTYKLPSFDSDLTYQVMRSEISGIYHAIEQDLMEQKIAYIPKIKIKYFEQEMLFGSDVFKHFPKSKSDIRNAGNCLAVDLNDAAVFHLMRTVEHGMRGLAKYLNVSIPEQELEYKDWKVIIDQIRSAAKTKTECSGMAEKEKSETREFYNGLLSEFEGFKDVWRNNIMHTRTSYKEGEAIAVFERVKNFMERLAVKVAE